ncbi:upstream stimulatory factor 2-like isoform X2 [Ptychodera flava]|uniref:upstream stimulatory factor 2-like isoform X2 n=2 Tax=Ptychodera flava TaxID=63121 RepID=UPI00396A2848
MDMLDQALDPSQDKGGQETEEQVQIQTDGGDQVVNATSDEQTAAAIASVTGQVPANLTDPSNLQYQFRTDSNGQSQVTYRVVQVAEGESGSNSGAVNVVTTTSFPQGQQTVTQQAVIQSPFSNGSSPTPESQSGETRFTYFPAQTQVSDATTAQTEGSLAQGASAGVGQFYVMMSPQDVLASGAQRSIAPRTQQFSPGKIDGPRTARDERRRATHNEVERRRRDKINNWIVKLSKIVPECAQDHSKQGQSKGGILAKTCDYIHELRTANARMAESLKETERLSVDAELLRQQVEEYKQENALLRAQLQQHGIEAVVSTSTS